MARAQDENLKQAYELYKSGLNLTEIASRLEVPASTIRSWKKRNNWDIECNATGKSVATKKRNVAKKDKSKIKIITPGIKPLTENCNLTEKQQEFCLYYIKTFNATQSYLKAYGCTYKTAMVEGSNALRNPKIRNEIARLKEAKADSILLDKEDIIEKYMSIAFADITDYVKFGQEEVPVMGPFGPISIKDEDTGEQIELTKVVNTVRFKESTEIDGTIISEVKQGRDGASIRLADKMKALEWLSNYFEMNPMNRYKIEFDKRKLEIEEKKADVGEDTKIINLIHSIPRPTIQDESIEEKGV
ncbi:terminase small subunit [Sedimentibacter hydroxybenzoicus DSM 7310]|uniref:Terminase small subunit n=1 Tax=Sedimentibacter hydroxybenzoicus DSM 7310 TaxID=1123245 RepID=A0A974BGB3_SEDHY|nr:terminase small subunit [Sedimentibacter hydroxybenzoicus]NYB72522.1 terminase small subunit [Sedimentibacter hydroxybenzoicus DSM 7310]